LKIIRARLLGIKTGNGDDANDNYNPEQIEFAEVVKKEGSREGRSCAPLELEELLFCANAVG
jgi:hypothetical protein